MRKLGKTTTADMFAAYYGKDAARIESRLCFARETYLLVNEHGF